MTKKYITHINDIELFKANAITCAELIDINNLSQYHTIIIKKVENLWEQNKRNYSICRCQQEE
jgi:hypothetical protein